MRQISNCEIRLNFGDIGVSPRGRNFISKEKLIFLAKINFSLSCVKNQAKKNEWSSLIEKTRPITAWSDNAG